MTKKQSISLSHKKLISILFIIIIIARGTAYAEIQNCEVGDYSKGNWVGVVESGCVGGTQEVAVGHYQWTITSTNGGRKQVQIISSYTGSEVDIVTGECGSLPISSEEGQAACANVGGCIPVPSTPAGPWCWDGEKEGCYGEYEGTKYYCPIGGSSCIPYPWACNHQTTIACWVWVRWVEYNQYYKWVCNPPPPETPTKKNNQGPPCDPCS